MKFPNTVDITNARQYGKAVDLTLERDVETLQHGQIYLANDDRFTQGTYSQPLTTFAVGGWGNTGLEQELQLYTGTPIQVPRRFSYKVWANAEALRSDTTEDVRAIGGDFKEVNLTSTEVNAKVVNRGLIMALDKDEVADGVITEQMAVQYLTSRIKLNQLRRASALLIAAATNTARTWLSGTRDADLDEVTAIHAYHTATGVYPNTVAYGKTAWLGRLTTMRALATAAGFASSSWSETELAAFLGVDTVGRVTAAYQSASATKTVVGASIVLTYLRSMSGMREDPSNLKYFWAPTDMGGGPVAAFRYEVGSKKIVVGVQHNELLAITYSGGIQTLTIS